MDGAAVKAVLDSSHGEPEMVVYRNGVPVLRVKDTSPNSIGAGQPGIGFFARPGGGLDLSAYCLGRLMAGAA